MSIFWMSLIGTSIVVFILRYTGHLIPEKYLTNPRMLKINTLIPVALLSALVAVQTFTKDSALVIDQRLAGLGVAIVALMFKAPFPVVVLGAAVTSAALFHFN
jgi:branched-subunit amino acid transport protein